jgi:hypothetical protein
MSRLTLGHHLREVNPHLAEKLIELYQQSPVVHAILSTFLRREISLTEALISCLLTLQNINDHQQGLLVDFARTGNLPVNARHLLPPADSLTPKAPAPEGP